MSEPPSALQASTLPSAISEQPDVLRSSISPGATAPGVESTPLGSITEDKAVIPPSLGASGSDSHPGVAVGTAAGPSASVSDSSIITPRAPTTANTTSDTTTPAAINTVPAAAAAPASASASASPAAPHLSEHEPLATELKPITAATLTIRIIKSFEFRTQKSLVLKEVDLEKITVGELMERCRRGECGVVALAWACLGVSVSRCQVSMSGIGCAEVWGGEVEELGECLERGRG
jgi:hypothetical protein